MKLKIRASGKDFAIFAMFAVVLFYLVAIVVLNISTFAIDGSFHGFNPVPALVNMEYLGPTIFGFIIIMIFIT